MKNKLLSRVEGILELHEDARDSDERLIWYYFNMYYRNPDQMTLSDTLRAMHNAQIPRFESISRLRRKVQNEREDLRGDKYEARKMKAAKVKSIFKN